MRKITMADGPLAGKSFLVPDGTVEVRHHAAPHGSYVVDGDAGHYRGEVFVDIAPDPTRFDEALADLAKLKEPESGFDEFLPVGLPRALMEARLGRDVLIVGRLQRDAEAAFDEVAVLAADDELVRIVRTNGRTRIDYPNGGSLVPVGVNTTRVRGRAADTLYVLAPLTDADLEPVLPALATSASPRVILHSEGAE